VKFRSDAAPHEEVSARHGSEAWVVTVRDNGIGVDPDHASRIFAMFARVNGESDGTGIGLAVCRRVVEAHGGRIWSCPPRAAAAPSASRCPAEPLSQSRARAIVSFGPAASGRPRRPQTRSRNCLDAVARLRKVPLLAAPPVFGGKH
jgi:hypothetical protein